MSFVEIRVDLPSYSRSFTVRVQPASSVLQLKQEISRTCPGQPRTDGQRLIWRGRLLADDENIDNLWKTEPRIVHLAVHPSAWSSLPPELPQPETQGQPQPTPTYPIHNAPSPTRNPLRYESTTPPQSSPPRPPMAYVLYLHQKALSCLSSAIPTPPPDSADASPSAKMTAVVALERTGFAWPPILDAEYPPSENGGVIYSVSVVEEQTYLQIMNPGEKPTPAQAHALDVLLYTFHILTLPSLATPPIRTVRSQSTPIPPHVNQLLQQLGIPPLRIANNNNHNAGVNLDLPAGAANLPNPGAVVDIRQIPIRPLLAPLVMLLFRTLLLLYFVAPTRKPIFGILILAWMLYEIWQPIRNGMRNGWGRIPEGQQQQQQRGNNAPLPAQNGAQGNVQFAPGGAPRGPAANVPVQPGPVGPVTLDLQAAAFFDNLANMNIEEEERMLNPAADATAPPAEPGLGHKATTFLGLLLTTLHPAIWNRRRAALRRREGVVRTEAIARNAPPSSSPPSAAPGLQEEGGEAQAISEGERVAAQRREELRAQFNRRPRWIQRYMERVVAEDWVDDSD